MSRGGCRGSHYGWISGWNTRMRENKQQIAAAQNDIIIFDLDILVVVLLWKPLCCFQKPDVAWYAMVL